MPLQVIGELGASSRAVAERYMDQVRTAMAGQDEAVVDTTIEDLAEHFCAVLEPASTSSDVEWVIAQLGPASAFGDDSAAPDRMADATRPAGRILGVPYDWRFTPERVASRWWNPRDQRIFMPRAFGIGWDINFGALAVKLHLIEPDAEDAPFSEVTDRAFLGALLVPVALTAFVVGTYLGSRFALPPALPSHWNAVGMPDGYWSQGVAFGFLLAWALLPTLWAVWAVATRRSPLTRAAIIGVASFSSALAAGVWALTLATVFASPVSPALPALTILPCFLVPFAVLLGLARAGRSAEVRRDIESPTRGVVSHD